MIAVWYHCKISGQGIPSREASIAIFREQMRALQESGLAYAADQIHVGVNGDQRDGLAVAELVPDKAILYAHGVGARSELPTFAVLRCWLPAHANWYVLYHHSKGVTAPQSLEKSNHRRLMENACVANWRRCVADLARGYDAVGINLVDPQTRPVLPGRFFAGNFWWAVASYLLTLSPIPSTVSAWTTPQRCIAEMWIGSAKTRPRFMDYERPELYPLS